MCLLPISFRRLHCLPIRIPTRRDDGEKITLMTVHSAKGLEFKNVFVVGLEENLFPSGMVGDSPRALEEERRFVLCSYYSCGGTLLSVFCQNPFPLWKDGIWKPQSFLA